MQRIKPFVEFTLIITLFFVMTGSAPPAVNEAHYWTKAKHFWNPSWCATDPFLASANAHFVYFACFGGITKLMSLPAAAWWGRLIGWALLASSWQWLSAAFVRGFGYALWSAAIACVLWQDMTMAGEWVVGGLEAKVVSYALVFLALGCALRSYFGSACLCVAGAAAMHPIVGLWSGLLMLMAWWDQVELRNIRPIAVPLLFTMLVIATVVLVTLTADPASSDVRRAANRIYVYQRLPHHLVLHRMETIRVVRFGALVALWILLDHWLTVGTNVDSSSRLRRLRIFVRGSLLLVAVGALLDLSSFVIPDFAARWLRFYWFRLSDVAVPVGIAILLIEWHARTRTQRPIATTNMLAVSLVLISAGVAWQFFATRNDRRPSADRQGQVFSSVDSQQALQQLDDWRDACKWAGQYTPSNSLFLTPTQSQTFRWYAERAELANWKDIPQDARGMVQWKETIDQIRRSGIYHVDIPVDHELLDGLINEHGVDYMVYGKAMGPVPMSWPLVYQNVSYCVYRVARESQP